MSKSRYIPYHTHKKPIRKMAEGKHRSRIHEWLKKLAKDIEYYEEEVIPSETLRKSFFSDWYW